MRSHAARQIRAFIVWWGLDFRLRKWVLSSVDVNVGRGQVAYLFTVQSQWVDRYSLSVHSPPAQSTPTEAPVSRRRASNRCRVSRGRSPYSSWVARQVHGRCCSRLDCGIAGWLDVYVFMHAKKRELVVARDYGSEHRPAQFRRDAVTRIDCHMDLIPKQ